MFGRKSKELQSLLEATRKSLKVAEMRAEKLKKLNDKNERRIKELEEECEFLFNNLSKKKRELLDADKHK